MAAPSFDPVRLALEAGARRAARVDPGTLAVSPEVRGLCEKNQCGQYGRNWACPPGAGELVALQERMGRFRVGVMFQTLHPVEDSYDLEGTREGARQHAEISDRAADALRRAADAAGEPVAEWWVMGAGGCSRCATCNYPAPCRLPDRAVAAMEACGLNVVELSARYGLPYIGGENTVTYFSLVLWR